MLSSTRRRMACTSSLAADVYLLDQEGRILVAAQGLILQQLGAVDEATALDRTSIR